jgi:putative transposase
MKASKFSESQIAFLLRQGEEGTTVEEICRKTGISQATYYNWKKKYGGLLPSEMKRLRQLEEENGRLKRIGAGTACHGRRGPSRARGIQRRL